MVGHKLANLLNLTAIQRMAILHTDRVKPNLCHAVASLGDMAVGSFAVTVILLGVNLALEVIVDSQLHVVHPFYELYLL